jgi:cell division protein FtsB
MRKPKPMSGTDRLRDVARAMTPPRFLRRYQQQESFRRRIRRALPPLVLGAIVFSLFASDTGLVALGIRFLKLRRLESDVARLEQHAEFLHAEQARREKDRSTLERMAREHFGMAYPGERVYRILEVDEDTARRIEREQREREKESPAVLPEEAPRASR